MWLTDTFVLLDNVQFAKRDFQNRNRIRASGTNDGWRWLTVPVLTKGKFWQLINEVEINNSDETWRKRCWRSIKQDYASSEHYDDYKDFLHDLYRAKSWHKLVDLNTHIIKYLREVLDIKAELLLASDIINGRSSEVGSATELLLRICQELGADTYVSGKFGKEYLQEESFAEESISVAYQDFQHPVYSQVIDPFVSNLSIIDLLLNCGERSRDVIRQN